MTAELSNFGTDLRLEANAHQRLIVVTTKTLHLPISCASKSLSNISYIYYYYDFSHFLY